MAKKQNKNFNLLQNNPDVPVCGWIWHWMYDFEKDYVTCEYCGQYPVRYLHILKHPCYPIFIRVGSDCASKLTQTSYSKMKSLETDFKKFCGARDRFIKNTTWKPTKNGNLIAYCTVNRIPYDITIARAKCSSEEYPLYAVACHKRITPESFANTKFTSKIRSDDFVSVVDITSLNQAKKVAFDLAYDSKCPWNMIDWSLVKIL